MTSNLCIGKLTQNDLESAYNVYKTTIPYAFEKEGLGSLVKEIQGEILHKRHMLEASLNMPESKISFLVAKLDDAVVGAISFGPCGEDAKKCTNNQLCGVGELGSLYILPDYQSRGIGSALIKAMAEQLHIQGIEQFCLDSGFKRAQKRWLRKFGEPYKVVKDYWGPGGDHMVWLCKVSDFI